MTERFVEWYIDSKNVPSIQSSLETLGFWKLRTFEPNGVIRGTDGITGELWVDEDGNRIMVAHNPNNPVSMLGADFPAGPILRDEG